MVAPPLEGTETDSFFQEYKEKRSQFTAIDNRVKELFTTLAKQELGHYLIVSSLSEYFDHPVEWV
jgi:hypothetical protein